MILRRYNKTKKRNATHKKHHTDYFLVENEFSIARGEGRIPEKLAKKEVILLSIIFFGALIFLLFNIANLQLVRGSEYRIQGEANIFGEQIIFAERGMLYDRNNIPLAWNELATQNEVGARHYIGEGFGSLLGFISYPQKDRLGKYYQQTTTGNGGLEELYNQRLIGKNGIFVTEENALGKAVSELYSNKATNGEDIQISIDGEVQEALYTSIKETALDKEFNAGAGVLLDIQTGEIIALASYPDFDGNALTNTDEKRRGILDFFSKEEDRGVFINRAISGLYTPGSTVKPFFAVAALEEQIIQPNDIIVSNGSIKVKNVYDPDIEYTFKDWRVHGPVNIYDAIAWSSNVYFYHIGGGYGHIQDALGIDRINFYGNIFGFQKPTRIGVFDEPVGLIPNADWKWERYEEPWTIGDTYNTVIGQYSFQVTPLQLARGIAAIANGGYMLEPHLNKNQKAERIKLAIDSKNLEIVRKGMRDAVLVGTGKALQSNAYQLAIKTGTAQIGAKDYLNSLVIGFFPYTAPRYSFVVVMEEGKQDAGIAATRSFFEQLTILRPEYLVNI